jgi:hypothetical protein
MIFLKHAMLESGPGLNAESQTGDFYGFPPQTPMHQGKLVLAQRMRPTLLEDYQRQDPRGQNAGTVQSNHPSPLQHCMQQHIAPGSDVLRLGIFNLVVADAVFAGDEDHAAGCQFGHVDRVVSGA